MWWSVILWKQRILFLGLKLGDGKLAMHHFVAFFRNNRFYKKNSPISTLLDMAHEDVSQICFNRIVFKSLLKIQIVF